VSIVEEWKTNGLAEIPEGQLQKIEGDYILQEELRNSIDHPSSQSNATKGILTNIIVGRYNPKGPSCKRGRKTTSQLLQELGDTLINEGKVKALAPTPTLSQ